MHGSTCVAPNRTMAAKGGCRLPAALPQGAAHHAALGGAGFLGAALPSPRRTAGCRRHTQCARGEVYRCLAACIAGACLRRHGGVRATTAGCRAALWPQRRQQRCACGRCTAHSSHVHTMLRPVCSWGGCAWSPACRTGPCVAAGGRSCRAAGHTAGAAADGPGDAGASPGRSKKRRSRQAAGVIPRCPCVQGCAAARVCCLSPLGRRSQAALAAAPRHGRGGCPRRRTHNSPGAATAQGSLPPTLLDTCAGPLQCPAGCRRTTAGGHGSRGRPAHG